LARKKKKSSFGGWLIVGVVVLIFGQIFKSEDAPSSSTSSAVTSPVTSSTQASTATEPSHRAPAAQVSTSPAKQTETRYVTATSLNVRSDPSSAGKVVGKIPSGDQIAVLEARDGWLFVQSASAGRGWVSEQFTSRNRPQSIYRPPAPLAQSVPAAASGQSCSPRRTCGQISSCSAAQWYRQNCSWGGRLDRDNDGIACESLC
jgi:uncharacterized protein YraI